MGSNEVWVLGDTLALLIYLDAHGGLPPPIPTPEYTAFGFTPPNPTLTLPFNRIAILFYFAGLPFNSMAGALNVVPERHNPRCS